MPNGGSDCCGTCWFNSKNEGEAGYSGSKKEGDVICQIRNTKIEDPFYTYCINHPHHNPNKIEIPLGPVYSGEERQILIKSVDNEEVRKSLLLLLREMEEIPINEYPHGRGLDEEVIVQIGNFNEIRAIDSLRRICKFDPLSKPKEKNPFNRTRIVTIGLAIEALSKISSIDALPEIRILMNYGLKEIDKLNYNPKEDKFAAIRYHATRALKYCDQVEAIELLKLSLNDPHQEISAFSSNILEDKIGLEEMEKIRKGMEIQELKNLSDDVVGKDFTRDRNEKNKWWEFWKKNN